MQSRPVLLGVLLLGVSTTAHATYSVVAADTRTHRTGGAGTSCIDGEDVFIIHGVVQGVGTIHAQATFNRAARDRGIELLRAGRTPAESVSELTSATFDADFELRQYGVVTVMGDTATFTGTGDGTYAGDRQGKFGTLAYAVQGNILTSGAVIDGAATAFESAGCDLPERLMRALEAGAADGEGDRRCTASRGIPSDSAFLRVSGGDGESDPYVELHVPTSGEENPLVELRSKLEDWRSTHPCDEPVVAPGTAGGSAKAGGAAPGTDGGQSGCTCHLPRGRTPNRLECWVIPVTAGLSVLRRRRPRARAIPSALSRE